MNKIEFINKHGTKAVEMVNDTTFVALMETAREENPFLMVGNTELSALQVAGAAIGWHKCLEALKTLHVPPPPRPEKQHIGAYKDPENDQPKLKP